MTGRLTMRRRLTTATPPPSDTREITGFWVRLMRLEEDAFFWYEGGWYQWLGWEFNPDSAGVAPPLDIDDLNPDTAVFVQDLKKVDTTWPDKPQAGAVVVKHKPARASAICTWKDLRVGDEFYFILRGQTDTELFTKCSDNMAESEQGVTWRVADCADPVQFVRSTLD